MNAIETYVGGGGYNIDKLLSTSSFNDLHIPLGLYYKKIVPTYYEATFSAPVIDDDLFEKLFDAVSGKKANRRTRKMGSDSLKKTKRRN